MAELLLGQPIFPGDSGVDQLVEIIKVLGTPTREQIREMNPNYTEFKFPQIKAHPWQKVIFFKSLINLNFWGISVSFSLFACNVLKMCFSLAPFFENCTLFVILPGMGYVEILLKKCPSSYAILTYLPLTTSTLTYRVAFEEVGGS